MALAKLPRHCGSEMCEGAKAMEGYGGTGVRRGEGRGKQGCEMGGRGRWWGG